MIWRPGSVLERVSGSWEYPINPLEPILEQVLRALEARIWHAALALTLTLPDICSLLELPAEEGWSKRHKYAGWFNRYVATKYQNFDGDDCYNIRGGVVHKGHFSHHNSKYDRVAFTLDGNVREIVLGHLGPVDKSQPSLLALDLQQFCEGMVEGVREWYEEYKDDKNVRANIRNVIRLRLHGTS